MSDPGRHPSDNARKDNARRRSLEDLDKRLKKARGEADGPVRGPGTRAGEGGAGAALAWRISIELVVAIGVCAAIGVGLDSWLGTAPWLLVLFLFLGFGAGIRNVYRATREIGEAAEENDGDNDRGSRDRGA